MTDPRRLRAALAALLLACAVGGAQPARASDASQAGWGLGSALSTLAYAPVKAAYATAGLLFGGLGWALSGGDAAVAAAVIAPAVRGDYVVTPAHLRGERRLEFVGVASSPAPPDEPLDAYDFETEYGDLGYGR